MEALNYDTHAHLDLYPNMKECLLVAENSKCYTIVVTNLPEIYMKYVREHTAYRYVRFALGLHPQLVSKYKSQMSIFCEEVEKSRYIGEVGLDFSLGSNQEQIEIFGQIMECCKNYGGKIISVHSRRAATPVMDVIGESEKNKIILHWFSGTKLELERAVKLGYYFSVNLDMLNSRKGRDLLANIPTEKLLIESDAPFTRMTQKAYSIDFIRSLVTTTAEIINRSQEEIATIYTENFVRLLQN